MDDLIATLLLFRKIFIDTGILYISIGFGAIVGTVYFFLNNKSVPSREWWDK